MTYKSIAQSLGHDVEVSTTTFLHALCARDLCCRRAVSLCRSSETPSECYSTSTVIEEGQEVSGLTSWEPFSIPNELRSFGPTLIFAAAFCLVFAWLELAGVLAGRHLSGVRAMVVGPSPIKSLLKELSGKPRALDRDQGEGQERRPNIDSPSDGLRLY